MSVGANLLQLISKDRSQDIVSEDGARAGNFNRNIVRNFNLHVQNIDLIDRIIEEDESISNFESNLKLNTLKPEPEKVIKPPRKFWGVSGVKPTKTADEQDEILNLLNGGKQEEVKLEKVSPRLPVRIRDDSPVIGGPKSKQAPKSREER